MSHHKCIAIIPARGGSKRIPKKNIKKFCGKPILQYAVMAAINSGIFDRVIVSTDSQEIANIALGLGAEVPFLRDSSTSDDMSTLGDALFETINRLNLSNNNLDYLCCILPTSPFLTSSFLVNSENLFQKGEYESLFPVKKYSYPIWRSLKLDENESTYSMLWPEHLNTRSQDLKDVFHDAGMFYFLRTEAFIKNRSVFLEKNGVIEVKPWFVQDIDDETDWEYAEIKYKLLAKLNKTLK